MSKGHAGSILRGREPGGELTRGLCFRGAFVRDLFMEHSMAEPRYRFDFCIVSDDEDWEVELADDLQRERPGVKCVTQRNWRLGEPHNKSLLKAMKVCRKIIVCFSENPKNRKAIIAVYQAVDKMIKDMEIEEDMLIPVKKNARVKIPECVEIFNAGDAEDSTLINKLLEALDATYDGQMVQTIEEENLSNPVQCTSLFYINDDNPDLC